jgi:hypothetical protein
VRYRGGGDFRAALGTPDEWIWIIGFPLLMGAVAGLKAALIAATILVALVAIGQVLEQR